MSTAGSWRGGSTRTRPGEPNRLLILTAGLVAAALLVGVLYVYSAYRFSPFLLPALTIAVTVAVVTVSRPEVGIAVAFALVPLGNFKFGGQNPWVFVTIWVFFLAAVALWRSQFKGDQLVQSKRLTLVVVIYFAVAVLGFVVAEDQGAARPVIRSLITGLLLFFAIVTMVRTRKQVQWVLGGIALGAFIVGAYAVYQHAQGFTASAGFFTASGDLVHRVTAGFSNPNGLGGFLIMVTPFLFAGAALQRRGRALYVIAILAAVYGIYLSFSRGALIGLPLIPLFFLRGRRILVAAPLIAILITLTAPGLAKERFASLTQSGSELATRTDIWRTAVNVWESNPVVGVGLGGYPKAYAQSDLVGKEFLPTTHLEPPPHAHNLFLAHLAEGGLLAFAALLALLIVAARRALDLRRSSDQFYRVMGSAALAFLLVLVLHNMFDVTVLEGSGIYFWGLLGLLSASWTMARAEGRV